MALDKLNPKLINTTGASDGDALVFRLANSQIEFGAVSTDTSGLSAGISGANTNINTVQSNVDTFATYSNSTFASTTYVNTEISNLVNSAPSTLDTLNEIAAALGNDANLSVTLTNQINSISSNTSIVETNLDTYGSYANSTFTTDTNLNIVQGNADAYATYANSTFVATNSSPTFTGLTVDTDTLYVDATTNRVGIGTTSPSYQVEIENTGSNALLVLDRTDGAACFIEGQATRSAFGSVGATPLALAYNSAAVVTIGANGAITVNPDGDGFTFPTSDGSSGQVLQTDGNGALSFATVAGGGDSGLVEANLSAFATYANSTFATSAGIDTYGIKYNFDTATTAADPGTGDFRFSIDWTTGSVGSSYSAYVSETDNDTTGIGPLLDTLTASTNTNKALIVLYKKSNPTINAKFYVTGQTDNGTWRTLDIEYIDRDNWASISNGDEVFMTISLIGDQGDSVTANTNINTVQSNVTIVETNLDTFASYANSTFATSTNLNTVSANVDAVSFGLSGANTNINTISGNLDAYATYANTAFSGGSGDASTVEGNLSAFATYANSTFALDTSLNIVQANLDSFATYANSTLATQASVNLVEGNLTAFANYINTNLHYTSEQYTSTASSNSFTLGSSVSDANNLLVSISGVVQSPNDDYIVDGNSLILNNTQPVPADLKVEVRNLAVSGRVPAAGIVGWRYISTNAVTLTANASYFIDVSDGPKTVTLPPSPVLGSTIKIIDVAGLAASNTITVAGNSEKIQRESTDLLVTSNAAGFTLIYSTAAYGWILGEV